MPKRKPKRSAEVDVPGADLSTDDLMAQWEAEFDRVDDLDTAGRRKSSLKRSAGQKRRRRREQFDIGEDDF